MPSIITLLAMPPGVQQTANDVLSEEKGGQWVRRRDARGECDLLPSPLRQLDGKDSLQL